MYRNYDQNCSRNGMQAITLALDTASSVKTANSSESTSLLASTSRFNIKHSRKPLHGHCTSGESTTYSHTPARTHACTKITRLRLSERVIEVVGVVIVIILHGAAVCVFASLELSRVFASFLLLLAQSGVALSVAREGALS